jgi:hypothetical protein
MICICGCPKERHYKRKSHMCSERSFLNGSESWHCCLFKQDNLKSLEYLYDQRKENKC